MEFLATDLSLAPFWLLQAFGVPTEYEFLSPVFVFSHFLCHSTFQINKCYENNKASNVKSCKEVEMG